MKFPIYGNGSVYGGMPVLGTLFTTYGRWCGAPIGGYLDCCGGGPCSACVNDTLSTEACSPSAACLAQCVPLDALDAACARHDTCLRRPSVRTNAPAPPCSGKSNNFCGCDAGLVSDLQSVDLAAFPFRFGWAYLFRYDALAAFDAMRCWQYVEGLTWPQCVTLGGGSPPRPVPHSFEFLNGTTCWSDPAACRDGCSVPCNASGCPGGHTSCSGSLTPSATGDPFCPSTAVNLPALPSKFAVWALVLANAAALLLAVLAALHLLAAGCIYAVERTRAELACRPGLARCAAPARRAAARSAVRRGGA